MKKIIKTFLVFVLVFSFAFTIFPNSEIFAEKQEETNQKIEDEKKEKKKDNEDESIPEPPSGENVVGEEEEVEVNAITPSSVTGERMQGNGTVVDFTTTGSKAFYTIKDNEQNVFYLIIDMDKTADNVYFLSDINRNELEGVIEEGGTSIQPPIQAEQGLEDSLDEDKPGEKEGGNTGFLLMVLILAVVGITAYYFLVIKKKQNDNAVSDEEMEDDYEDDFFYEEESEETEEDQQKND